MEVQQLDIHQHRSSKLVEVGEDVEDPTIAPPLIRCLRLASRLRLLLLGQLIHMFNCFVFGAISSRVRHKGDVHNIYPVRASSRAMSRRRFTDPFLRTAAHDIAICLFRDI